jgi:DNA-binding MarR family transcriptional regulator
MAQREADRIVNQVDDMVNQVYVLDMSERHLVDALDEHQPLGRHLVLLFKAFENELLSSLHRHERFASITTADHDILRFIKPAGTTATAIAHLNGTSKQAVAKALASLEERGFVVRQPHPDDARAQIVLFSKDGQALAKEALRIVARIEARYEAALGRKEFTRLKKGLRDLFATHGAT